MNINTKNKKEKNFITILPPKNMVDNKKQENRMLLYSPKKNKAKGKEEYSTLNPETSSDSPSVKSKGALLVSATKVIKNITKIGVMKKNKLPHTCWYSINFSKEKDPLNKHIVFIKKPKDTS